MRAFVKEHKFGIALLFALFIAALIVRLSGGCPIYRIFGIECITCGMFHACLSALRFDFDRAFHLHPMFWSVPIVALYILFEGKLFKHKSVNIGVMAVIVLGFIFQWLIKYKGYIVG